jgi:formylglycine-generating enzyme required for sulfatase activity
MQQSNAVLRQKEMPVGCVFADPLADGELGPEMAVLASGEFLMGSPRTEKGHYLSEEPQHKVVFVQAFAMGRYPAVFDEYDRFCAATGRPMPDDEGWGRGRRPVANVRWNDAEAYAAWLSAQTGEAYRLPSEAEWEYACRAGSTQSFFWGESEEDADRYAWFERNSGGRSQPVGEKSPNAFGLHDMAGNVWEWTADWWIGNYAEAPLNGEACRRKTRSDPLCRVARGGSWIDYARDLRSAFRIRFRFDRALNLLGFRLVREV